MSYEFDGRDIDGRLCRTGYYGIEVAFDCEGCDVSLFNRKNIRKYFNGLVKILKMKKGPVHFWDDTGVPEAEKQTDPMTTGTSAIQFIITSNITIHTLDLLGNVYVNIFSCKDFSEGEAKQYTWSFFKATRVRSHYLQRD